MSKKQIFVVDDDDDVRNALVRGMRLRGLEVQAFSSGASFLSEVDPATPGCLVLDQGMPGMSGLELQRKLNDQGYLLKVIFVTGHGNVEQSVQAMRMGAFDFLEKPLRHEHLFERIETALSECGGPE